jgi:hypothetical protein
MNLAALGKIAAYLGTAAAILYGIGAGALFLAVEEAYPTTTFWTAWAAAFLMDTKVVIGLGVVLLLPVLIVAVALSITHYKTTPVETTVEEGGKTTTTKTSQDTVLPGWKNSRRALLATGIVLFPVIWALFIASHILEQDVESENVTGMLLSHDSEYWYVLVDNAELVPGQDAKTGATANEVKATEGDIKSIPVEKAGNVRIIGPAP